MVQAIEEAEDEGAAEAARLGMDYATYTDWAAHIHQGCEVKAEKLGMTVDEYKEYAWKVVVEARRRDWSDDPEIPEAGSDNEGFDEPPGVLRRPSAWYRCNTYCLVTNIKLFSLQALEFACAGMSYRMENCLPSSGSANGGNSFACWLRPRCAVTRHAVAPHQQPMRLASPSKHRRASTVCPALPYWR